ncbi:Phosphatidylinositol-4-phosphate 5-kinase 8 -like protein [Gossypium arboreum]|uniref:Phosphatidylinositol-4-phosphate 5-kinase 8-like protein n=1 Tax=Gossypium arboreum TaxID=29729 RepID=A0A0B0MXJ4_GOSAR|nr:Phosphatidylinositol-4-phosphate 5-kinase 8 -like protein [Gossypium arboreum]
MHQKKSEVQIGKESSGVSSDFNPKPSTVHHHHHHQHHHHNLPSHHLQHFNYHHSVYQLSDTTATPISVFPQIVIQNPPQNDAIAPASSSPSSSSSSPTPYKRPLLTQTPSLTKTPTLYRFTSPPHFSSPNAASFFSFSIAAKSFLYRILRRFKQLRCLRVHLRLILLLSLPFFYFLVSHPSHSFLLDFLSAFAFSAALLFSLNLALPRLPSIRLFLARSFPIKLKPSSSLSRSHLPVFWSIGSRPKSEKRANSGCWVQVYSNGDVYEGEFHKGKCSGSGVYYYYLSGRYEGDWVDGKYDGYGVETWARGSRYREWSNGQGHGCGIHTCEDGSRYVGEFKWGVKHGLGRYHFRNGDTYAGEYFADKMHGFGVYCFANGHCYEGAWHEGRRQGLGMYTFRNGEAQSGHWQNGVLNVPSTQNSTYPVSPVAVYHSKVLNAVQEARRAAEKAYDVAKVDERVNKAVAAANRAANAARVIAVKAVQKQMHHTNNNDNIPIPIPIM